MLNRTFFINVLWILRARGWTQKDLAERAKMSNSFLSNIVNGDANPSLRIMNAIAKALDVPLIDLLSPDLNRFAIPTQKDTENLENLEKIPIGYEKITVVLPKFKARQVKKMAEFFAKKNL